MFYENYEFAEEYATTVIIICIGIIMTQPIIYINYGLDNRTKTDTLSFTYQIAWFRWELSNIIGCRHF